MIKREVMIYARYERLWHWAQAILIFTLAVSGFGLHGTHDLLDFHTAVEVHTYAAVTLVVLWIFTGFWHVTTGQWRQYLFKAGIVKVLRFYAYGILVGEPHPYKKSLQRKQNALQSIAYVAFLLVIAPVLWVSGGIYMLYDVWSAKPWSGDLLTVVAFLHTAAAFAMVLFVIVHIYMATTGKTPLHYIKTMITGYDLVELSEAEEAYLKENKSIDMK